MAIRRNSKSPNRYLTATVPYWIPNSAGGPHRGSLPHASMQRSRLHEKCQTPPRSARAGYLSATPVLCNRSQQRTCRNAFAVPQKNLGQYSGGRRRDFDGRAIGFDLNQRFIEADRISDTLEPSSDRRLGRGCHDLRYSYFRRHESHPLEFNAV